MVTFVHFNAFITSLVRLHSIRFTPHFIITPLNDTICAKQLTTRPTNWNSETLKWFCQQVKLIAYVKATLTIALYQVVMICSNLKPQSFWFVTWWYVWHINHSLLLVFFFFLETKLPHLLIPHILLTKLFLFPGPLPWLVDQLHIPTWRIQCIYTATNDYTRERKQGSKPNTIPGVPAYLIKGTWKKKLFTHSFVTPTISLIKPQN